LFELARKQKKTAKEPGFRDEDVDTDEDCVRRNKKWMTAELKETIMEFYEDHTQDAFKDIVWGGEFNRKRNRAEAIFQHVS
jgi:hypothetical protein